MKIRVAVTSSNGRVIDLHFGRCSNFFVAEIDSDTGKWQIIENRQAEHTCHNFTHQEEHVKEIVNLLSDCRFLLTYRIGSYPYSLFRSRGITCFETSTEEPEAIDMVLKNFPKHLTVHPFSESESEEAGRKETYLE